MVKYSEFKACHSADFFQFFSKKMYFVQFLWGINAAYTHYFVLYLDRIGVCLLWFFKSMGVKRIYGVILVSDFHINATCQDFL